jgi:hypothetical protein
MQENHHENRHCMKGKVEGTRTIDLTGKNLTAQVAAGVKAND